MDLVKLAERVETAGAPDRELDAEIFLRVHRAIYLYCGQPTRCPGCTNGCRPNRLKTVWPTVNGGEPVLWYETLSGCSGGTKNARYTASLDAAMTLVPEGWHTRLAMEDRHSHSWRWDLRGGFGIERGARAATPALALCAAALRALAEQQK